MSHGNIANAVAGAAPASAPVSDLVLDVDDVCVQLANTNVLEDITFKVHAGEFVGIAGPNGGGKSTLLRAVVGLVPTCCGSIALFGQKGAPLSVRRRIAYLAQNEAHVDPLFPATAMEVAMRHASLGRGGSGTAAMAGAD